MRIQTTPQKNAMMSIFIETNIFGTHTKKHSFFYVSRTDLHCCFALNPGFRKSLVFFLVLFCWESNDYIYIYIFSDRYAYLSKAVWLNALKTLGIWNRTQWNEIRTTAMAQDALQENKTIVFWYSWALESSKWYFHEHSQLCTPTTKNTTHTHTRTNFGMEMKCSFYFFGITFRSSFVLTKFI